MRPVLPARSRSLLTALLLVVTSFAAVVGPVGSAEARAGYGSYIVLVPGDHGSRVAALQRFLHVRPASGYFGPRTRAAVKRGQGAHHRHRTGLVGKRLWRAVKGSGTSARRAPAPSRSGDRASTLNWRALARCESSGNPRAVNPAGYYGLYQFSPATWRSVGGSGLPSRASAAEQTKRAQILFRRSGSGPWPVCGRHLFD
jgi:peptidoglycan hydrolase-like protein with peptidoglycan-binding domain